MGVHPIKGFEPHNSAQPTPANDGPTALGSLLPSVVGRLYETLTSFEPRYFVRDGLIVTTTSGRTQTPQRAREALAHYVDDALTVKHADLVDIDVIHIVHLIHAIREAEGTDPTPPASMARAA